MRGSITLSLVASLPGSVRRAVIAGLEPRLELRYNFLPAPPRQKRSATIISITLGAIDGKEDQTLRYRQGRERVRAVFPTALRALLLHTTTQSPPRQLPTESSDRREFQPRSPRRYSALLHLDYPYPTALVSLASTSAPARKIITRVLPYCIACLYERENDHCATYCQRETSQRSPPLSYSGVL